MLKLGSVLTRSFSMRIPFCDNFCDVTIFSNKKSAMTLFKVEVENRGYSYPKIKMNSIVRGNKFCDRCINLHSYQAKKLDIVNQFNGIKPEYEDVVIQNINETIVFNRLVVNGNELSDKLEVYGFGIIGFEDEYSFIISERQFPNYELGDLKRIPSSLTPMKNPSLII